MSISKKSFLSVVLSTLAIAMLFTAPAKAESNPFADQSLVQVETPDGHGHAKGK